jgi:hypothetical protein
MMQPLVPVQSHPHGGQSMPSGQGVAVALNA